MSQLVQKLFLKRFGLNLKATRCISNSIKEIPEHLLGMMHGRRNKERRDSVTENILVDRLNHMGKIHHYEVNETLVKYIDEHGLGVKKRRNHVYQKLNVTSSLSNMKLTVTGAGTRAYLSADLLILGCTSILDIGGVGSHISSAINEWPIFEHLLPEIVFSGHSNSGKSTLVNAMIGVMPRKGPASVSDRAGWTDQICFYKLGKKPPVLTLVDFPGYGHAVASAAQRRAWTQMTKEYLLQREILSLCCVLVDSTRGLCDLDRNFLHFLAKHGIPRLVIMTKADLLDVRELAASISIVANDLVAIPVGEETGVDPITGSRLQGPLPLRGYEDIVPVSASTGAGVQTLWRVLTSVVDHSVAPLPDSHEHLGEGMLVCAPVREHRRAQDLRRRYSERLLADSLKVKPATTRSS